MKINSVIEKHVIVINGVEYIRESTVWTESIDNAKKEGVEITDIDDVFDWIEQN